MKGGFLVDKEEGISSFDSGKQSLAGTDSHSSKKKCPSAGADFKAIIRPLITAFLIIGAIGCVWAEIEPPDWYLGITITAFGWWFISRQIEKRNE